MQRTRIPLTPAPLPYKAGGEGCARIAPLDSSCLRLLATSWILVLTAGCATHYDRIQPVREAFFAGRLDEATTLLDKKRDLRLRNGDVKELDRAMIQLASGRPREAEKILRTIRDRFDHLEQTSLAEKGASFLTDDNIKAYPGEDYEKILIRSFLALSNLLTDGGDASAYALQVTDKQDDVIRKAVERHKEEPQAVLAYKQVALGPYVWAMIAEESPLTLDDAARARLQVVNWAPDFRDAKLDLQRAQHEVPIASGCGALYVFALVGRGPVKEEVAEVPTQVALLIADRIVSANSNRGLPPTLAPVKVPRMLKFPRRADGVAVQVDGRPAGQTATLVDVGEMAWAQHEAKYPYIVAEAVARRVIKKAVIYGAKEAVDAEHWSPESIALSAAGVAWEATESADTRCWSLLPDTIQVLRVELPVGEHELSLCAVKRDLAVGPPAWPIRVAIQDGRNTCVLGMFPEDRLVGRLMVSGQDAAVDGASPASGQGIVTLDGGGSGEAGLLR